LREGGPQTPKKLAEILGKKDSNIRALLWKMANNQEVKSINGKYEIIKK